MHLHSRALRYLDEVTRTGSIRKAASQLHVTSSALNRRILLLEQDLGTPIYERHPKGLRLTAAGEVLIEHVRRTLQDLERAESEIEDLRGLRRGRVHIAVIEGAAVEMVATVLARFNQQFPGIAFTLTIAPSAQIPALVSSGEAHIGVLFNSPVTRGIRQIASASLQIGVVMATGHPLAAERSVKLQDCIRHPICFAGADVSVAPIITETLAKSDVEIEPFVICNSMEVLKAIVREGLGVTFKSALGIEREIERGELLFKPLAEGLSERLVLVEPTGGRLPVAAAELKKFLKDAIGHTDARLRELSH